MDLDGSFLHNQLEGIEEDDLDDGTFTAGTAMAVIVLGVIELHRLRTERRKPSRLYLCRPQLTHRRRRRCRRAPMSAGRMCRRDMKWMAEK